MPMPSSRLLAKSLVLTYASSLIPSVIGHGYVQWASTNSATYGGFNEPAWAPTANTPILVTAYETPTYDVNGGDITCGISPHSANQVASVSVGETIKIKWSTHQDAPWTHNEGTHRVFIGPCPNDDCQNLNPADVEWSELSGQYVGQQTWDPNTSTWPVLPLANNQPWTVTVPPAPSGKYLIRDELTALHYSTNYWTNNDPSVNHGWGTEFYVTCMAIQINNPNAGTLDISQAMHFPGAYYDNQPGHYNPNIWSDPSSVILASVSTFGRTVWPSGSSSPNTGSGNTGSTGNNGSGNSSGGNNNNNSTPSSSQSAVTPTISNPACQSRRRRRSLFGRRHQQHRRQARSL